jgi:hypothetical protein
MIWDGIKIIVAQLFYIHKFLNNVKQGIKINIKHRITSLLIMTIEIKGLGQPWINKIGPSLKPVILKVKVFKFAIASMCWVFPYATDSLKVLFYFFSVSQAYTLAYISLYLI